MVPPPEKGPVHVCTVPVKRLTGKKTPGGAGKLGTKRETLPRIVQKSSAKGIRATSVECAKGICPYLSLYLSWVSVRGRGAVKIIRLSIGTVTVKPYVPDPLTARRASTPNTLSVNQKYLYSIANRREVAMDGGVATSRL